MLIDTFLRGYAATEDMIYFSKSITFRAINYLSCVFFVINIMLIQTKESIRIVRFWLMLSIIFRVFTKAVEFIYVYSIVDQMGKVSMLVEFNVSALLDISVLQCTGLYSFRKIVYFNLYLAFMGILSTYLATQDFYKGTYHMFNVAGVVLMNLFEYWVFCKNQMDNFIKLIEIDR